jgi:uncharacterized Zn finger protein (UPF0148 family)
MTKRFCRQCGRVLTKEGAKFCTICGKTVDGAETDDVTSQETAPLLTKQTDQTGPSNFAATEVLPASKPHSNFETEEISQVRVTAQAEKSATAVVAVAPVTQPQKKRGKSAPAKRPLGGRKGLALAASLGVVALATVSIFFVISRRPPETQSANLTANTAAPGASAQPTAQQSNQQPDPGANNQTQPQTGPKSGPAPVEVKSPAAHNAEATSNQQGQAVAKPTPATSQEKQPANETVSVEQYLKQGITYLNSGRHQEALRDFEYVRQLDPGNKDVYYLIGQAYQRMNSLKQALEAYRQCTSGVYASVSQSAVKKLEKEVDKN